LTMQKKTQNTGCIWSKEITVYQSISKYSKVPKQGGTAETASHMVVFSTGNMFTLFS
jgi:hypothetical protein